MQLCATEKPWLLYPIRLWASVLSHSASDSKRMRQLLLLTLPRLRGVVWTCACDRVRVCMCLCSLASLEGWQKSSSDGLQLCLAAVADASGENVFLLSGQTLQTQVPPPHPALSLFTSAFFFISVIPCFLFIHPFTSSTSSCTALFPVLCLAFRPRPY